MQKFISYMSETQRGSAWISKSGNQKTKNDCQDYKPNSLCSMESSIERYLLERGYTHSILKSRKFASSKIVLKGKVQVIPKDGKGRRPNKSSSLVFNSNQSSSRTCPFSSFSGGLWESAILKFFSHISTAVQLSPCTILTSNITVPYVQY